MNTVLVVDDEEMIRNAIAKSLRRRGFETLEAESGRLAFELLSSHSVQLVISDIRMPDGDGLELAKRIRGELKNPPLVILISGFSNENTEDISGAALFAFLHKPFEFKELFELVTRACPP